jgi:hypothetical protein
MEPIDHSSRFLAAKFSAQQGEYDVGIQLAEFRQLVG